MRRAYPLVIVTVLIGLTVSIAYGAMDLEQSVARKIVIGPFLDKTDAQTKETALTVHGWTASITYEDVNGAVWQKALTITASGGDNDATHLGGGEYSLELTADQLKYLGNIRVDVLDVNALPVWENRTVKPSSSFNPISQNDGLLPVDLVTIDADSAGTDQTVVDLIDFLDNAYNPDSNTVEVNDTDFATTETIKGGFRQVLKEPWSSHSDPNADSVIADANNAATIVAHATYGLSAVRSAIDANGVVVAAIKADTDLWDTAAEAKTLLFGADANGVTETAFAVVKAVTDKLDAMLALDGAVYQWTPNSLELAPTGSGSGGWDVTWSTDLNFSDPTKAGYLLKEAAKKKLR